MKNTVHISHPVGAGHPTFVIAEIGINHNGDLEIAKRLIDAAKEAGCNAVKFQKRTVDVVYTAEELAKPREVPRELLEKAIARDVLSKDAVERLTKSDFVDSTNGDLKWALELTKEEYEEIDRYCKEKDIIWFASPWDEASVDFLEQFDPPCYKIASASLTDDELLKHIRSKGRPIIISTGMSTLEEIKHAVKVLGTEDLILMHTRSTYPSALSELNLKCIESLQEEFPEVPVGYSGHEAGLYTTLAAVVLGACVVERHVTLDRSMWGSDQAASVEPSGMERLIKDIRVFEEAYGDGMIRRYESEEPIKQKLRRKG
jgi:N-acetylneuraminate synthase